MIVESGPETEVETIKRSSAYLRGEIALTSTTERRTSLVRASKFSSFTESTPKTTEMCDAR